jgi:hypothetical protein
LSASFTLSPHGLVCFKQARVVASLSVPDHAPAVDWATPYRSSAQKQVNHI